MFIANLYTCNSSSLINSKIKFNNFESNQLFYTKLILFRPELLQIYTMCLFFSARCCIVSAVSPPQLAFSLLNWSPGSDTMTSSMCQCLDLSDQTLSLDTLRWAGVMTLLATQISSNTVSEAYQGGRLQLACR